MLEMFGIKILTKRQLDSLLQAERAQGYSRAIDTIVDLCKQKEKIYLDTIEVHGNGNTIGENSLILGCEIGIKVYPSPCHAEMIKEENEQNKISGNLL